VPRLSAFSAVSFKYGPNVWQTSYGDPSIASFQDSRAFVCTMEDHPGRLSLLGWTVCQKSALVVVAHPPDGAVLVSDGVCVDLVTDLVRKVEDRKRAFRW